MREQRFAVEAVERQRLRSDMHRLSRHLQRPGIASVLIFVHQPRSTRSPLFFWRQPRRIQARDLFGNQIEIVVGSDHVAAVGDPHLRQRDFGQLETERLVFDRPVFAGDHACR